jgi:YidC/Oxa1 family membrane protein insertase
MTSLGLDLSLSPAEMLGENFARGLIYAALVVLLGGLYFFQQRMVAARAAVSPTMSASQQKMMQYLPVVFAVFQIFFLLGLVVYYIVQSVLRILQQFYITKRFYGHEHSLGRQAQAASERARELSKEDGGGGGPFAQARRDLTDAKKSPKPAAKSKKTPTTTPEVRPSKRTTPPKNRPTPSAKRGSGKSSGRPSGRPSTPNKRKGK